MSFADTFATFGYNPPVNNMEASNFYTLEQMDSKIKSGDQVRATRYRATDSTQSSNGGQATSSGSTAPNASQNSCGCQVLINGVPATSASSSGSSNSNSTSNSSSVPGNSGNSMSNSSGANANMNSNSNSANSGINPNANGNFSSNNKYDCGDFVCWGEIDQNASTNDAAQMSVARRANYQSNGSQEGIRRRDMAYIDPETQRNSGDSQSWY